MYSNVERSTEYINNLLDFLRKEYSFDSIAITPARRGFFGETWKVTTTENVYFVKLDYVATHQRIYESSFQVVEHINNHGIDFISKIVKTIKGNLSTYYDGAVLGVFNWIDGENLESNSTKPYEYRMLAKIYTVPTHGAQIPYEDFSGNADKFYEQWNALEDKQLLLLLDKNKNKLEHRAKRLNSCSGVCRGNTDDFVITHGDAGGNLVVNGDKYYIVDWDNPVLAPPERDAWVMCCHHWARIAFQNALHENGIKHTLRPERLAYYCYDFFFYYLTEYLNTSLQETGFNRV